VKEGPLAGIRILEGGVMLAGPYAHMLLAAPGPQVHQIHPPGGQTPPPGSAPRGAERGRADGSGGGGQQELCDPTRGAPGRSSPRAPTPPPPLRRRGQAPFRRKVVRRPTKRVMRSWAFARAN